MVNAHFSAFKKNISHPIRFRVFMLTRLPSAWFAGLKLVSLTTEEAKVSVRQKWFNKNPFRSIYVAILSMPSEVSTGVLCMGAIYNRKPPLSMLVISNEGFYYKKATGTIVFTCNEGAAINDAVERAIQTGEATTIRCHTIGTNEKGEVVAEFYYTWSFKQKGSAKVAG
ncbi:DUF4442 domain-containing protein [Segetibacter sp. 3557_3]|uniref:DUF4442 domain-containing protein n=1 Tax=Segetibacter sp. 3557_3 TaxID=2547429 RepID=UPI001058BD6C|nr:DUF4442 domain-containing protein [Segetibacter sp. 3557_3]TDH26055.1 DUF4442 domain-containing protein [Segetibacter sp. 3557_3]